MRLFVSALLALNVALAYAAPQNGVTIEGETEEKQVAVVGAKKGDPRALFQNFQNDQAMVKTCVSGRSCEFMTVAQAKALEYENVNSVQAVKGESAMTKALSPTLVTMSESMRSLQAQTVLLAQLEQSMAAMRATSLKGQQVSQAANANLASSLSKGVVYSPPKAAMNMPILSASKGGMNAPVVNCPMVMFELRQCQDMAKKLKEQLDATTAMNAHLLVQKRGVEQRLEVSEMQRMKAEEQAQSLGKLAVEQKAMIDRLSATLNMCTVEKAATKAQKEKVEADLAVTQTALAGEKAENEKLTADLAECKEENAALNQSLAEQTKRAETAEEQLASTKAKLEAETRKVIELEESLSFTRTRLSRCDSDLKRERSAREQTEEVLMKTMTELSSCNSELKVSSEMLTVCRDDLQEKITALAGETAAKNALTAKLANTTEALRTAEQEIRDTKLALENEQNAHTTTRRLLAETQEELERTEAARQALAEANQKLQEELAETKAQLDTMTEERNQLQSTLDATSAAYAQCKVDLMTCETGLEQRTSALAETTKQLTEAAALLKQEKEAREQLTATILLVQQTSIKVQQEVKKLQEENLMLQSQVQKLQSEQEVAMALAAGCPPTYEKFGSSCYKYVREKTQWKMAQEQCMKDKGNLVAIENTQEQIFITNFLKRHGASDAYSYTSGNKQVNGWKWLGASDNHIGASGVEFWYNAATKVKPGYDCQAVYLYDSSNYGKWVALPCYSSTPYICEYNLVPHSRAPASNSAEQVAILKMAEQAPYYLKNTVRL